MDLQLPMQSVPITTNIVISNPVHGEVYSLWRRLVLITHRWYLHSFLVLWQQLYYEELRIRYYYHTKLARWPRFIYVVCGLWCLTPLSTIFQLHKCILYITIFYNYIKILINISKLLWTKRVPQWWWSNGFTTTYAIFIYMDILHKNMAWRSIWTNYRFYKESLRYK
jgi:hypothetical protein